MSLQICLFPRTTNTALSPVIPQLYVYSVVCDKKLGGGGGGGGSLGTRLHRCYVARIMWYTSNIR